MSKSVLIFEPHPYHYEVVIGVSYYFEQLGYEISLLVRNNFDAQDLFFYSQWKDRLHIRHFDDETMKAELETERVRDYEFLFLSSMEYFHDHTQSRILDYIGFIPQTKYGIMGIYHNRAMLTDDDIKLLSEGRIFALTPFTYKGYQAKRLSVSYFGEFDIHDTYGGKPEILLVGGSNKRILFENAIGNLIKRGCRHFNAGIIGVNPIQHYVLKTFIRNFIFRITACVRRDGEQKRRSVEGVRKLHFYGKLKFKEMYSVVLKAAYIGIIMDPEDDDFSDFLYGKTTGARQLAFAFCKPCIINRKFAKAFGLNEDCCILYDGNHVEDAVYRAVHADINTYKGMVRSMAELKEQMVKDSLENLLETVNGVKHAAG
ncbi:hypothetical protein D3Z50_17695 [Clostridiaceae bacterium]|nr:hypothetical protein [Clostridiaceae bacterium]